jgi:glycosyltransferase involved in cell wall biosynthesis
VSPSAHQAADLEAAGVRPPIHVIPNPIARSPRPPKLLTATQASRPTILWVARCEAVKRPLVFAKAAIEALERTNNGFEVDFVGDGAELDRLRKLTAGHPGLRVHGAKDHDTVMRMMDDAGIVALTSFDFDNQPMIIAEAVNRLRGVLYCDPKLQEGLRYAGFLAASPDARGLADAIVELAKSPQILVDLSRGAARDADTFSPTTYVERTIFAYRAARG